MTLLQSDLIFLAGLCVVILLAGITGGDDNVAQ